ncbi:TetR/AcrR family transcriptional regulator [Endothiovibrio diazotrophicus]
MGKREKQSADLRQRVLDTALRLFSERGYFNTSVHDIRREAEVSIGSIYHHFANKEAVAKALYASILSRLEELVEEAIDRHTTTHDRARSMVERLFRLTEEEPRVVAFALSARHREFMADEPPVCSSRPFARMRELVNAGIERGELLHLDPAVAAAALFGGPIRMVQLRLDGMESRPLPELLDEVWRCAWRAVAHSSEAIRS